MLLLEGVSLKHHVQDRLLFDIELLQVHAHQCIGLVGRNGSGKTTLLEIIAGKLLPDEGGVHSFTQRATKKPKNISSSEARIKGVKTHYANIQKKLRQTAKAFESRLDQLEQVERPKDLPAIKMDVVNLEHIKNQVIVRAEQLSGHVESRELWKPFNLFVRSGDKLAIIGPNGAGKTTLLKKLIDHESGIWISPAVKVGYFSQHLTIVDEEKTILENIQIVSSQHETLIRTVLARLHFWGDDVYKKVAVLSGGEKVKVALTTIFLSDVNMLVLDEPTNFLDIESLEAFEALMKSYDGTVIFATHDRMLVRNVATKIVDIENQEVTVFDGTYEAFEERVNHRKEDSKENERIIIENKISDVLGRLSIEPSEQLEAEFQKLLKEKNKLVEES